MPGGESARRRQQSGVGRGVEGAEKHDQGTLGDLPQHLRRQQLRVGLDERGLQRGQDVHQLGQHVRPGGRAEARADGDIGSDERHPVTGPRGHRGQQQAGVQRGVQAGFVAEPSRRRTPGVDREHDLPVAFGSPRPHHDVAGPGRRPPVDRAHVVAEDVGAQRVELAALTALAHEHGAIDLAQPRQLLRQEAPRGERRQHPHRPGHGDPPLPGGDPDRPVRADRHLGRAPLPATCRRQDARHPAPFAGRHRDRLHARAHPRRGHPRVAQVAAQRPSPGVGHLQDGRADARRGAPTGWRPARTAGRRSGPRARGRAATRTSSSTTYPSAALADAAAISTPSAASATSRPVIAIGQRGAGTDARTDSSTPVDGDALQLGLRTKLDPVPERRPGQRLHVIGRDELAAGQPRPRARGRRAARSRRAARRRAGPPGPAGSTRANSTM